MRQVRRTRRTLAAALTLVVWPILQGGGAALAGEAAERQADPPAATRGRETATPKPGRVSAPVPGHKPAREEVVFSSEREETADGVVLWDDVSGELDETTAQLSGRPWSHMDEPALYRTHAWSTSGDGRTTRYGYRVLKTDNPAPRESRDTEWARPEVDPGLAAELAQGDPQALLPLQLDVRGLAEWDVPLRPTGFALSAHDLQQVQAGRDAALARRRDSARELIAPVRVAVQALGGEAVAEGLMGGWITVRVPASAVPVLLERTDLRRVSLIRGRAIENAKWDLGDVRSDSYIDARQFLSRGYTGETANPSRHGFGDITVGVIEIGQLEGDACFLYDGADCSGATRLQELFRCDDQDRDGNYCEPVGFFRDNDDSASHGTLVSSVILGDYSQGQGDPYRLGDAAWTAELGHGAAWTSSQGGMAPEARLIFFGQMADNDTDDGTVTSAGLADAFDDAIDRSVDITNSSWGWNSDGSSSCDLRAVAPHEQELENAFDDGIFNVVSAGNPNDGYCTGDMPTPCVSDARCQALGLGTCNSDSVCTGDPGTECDVNADCSAVGGPCTVLSQACSIGSPADLPKSFAVNALNGEENTCELAYGNCLTDVDYSANGGITATVNGVTCPGCVSGIDLTAPNRICGTTGATGLHGTGGSCFNGTSAAAPVVAGAAALVKDQYLSTGQTWINNPGMLHTIMLNMGDRNTHAWGQTSTTQMGIGSSDLTGMGRLKLRLLENGAGMGPWGNSVVSASFNANSGDYSYYPWETPIPAGVRIAKCVLYQVEDMSGKDDISRIDLEMRLRDPVSGACFDPGSPVRFTWTNSGTEIKKMTALTSSQTTLAGRCLEITMDLEHATAQGATGIVNCYYAGVEDEFSAPD